MIDEATLNLSGARAMGPGWASGPCRCHIQSSKQNRLRPGLALMWWGALAWTGLPIHAAVPLSGASPGSTPEITATGGVGSGKREIDGVNDSWLPPLPILPDSALVQEVLLVGILVNGKEVASIEILRGVDGNMFIPLEAFVSFAGCRLARVEAGPQLQTPLGNVDLVEPDIVNIGGVVYLTQAFIEERLYIRVTFDQREFALRFDVPWQPGAELVRRREAPQPEILAPGTSLSRFRAEAGYTSKAGGMSLPTAVSLSGRLADGIWRARYDMDLETGRRHLPEYTWLRPYGRTLYQVGQQRIQLHPLLAGFELTGAQASWSNRSLDRLGSSIEGRELLARRALPLRTFRGQAPPGGRVQLRIEGVVVRQQNVGLSGEYEFVDVPIPARQVRLIEILIFDRDRFQAPSEIREYTITSSELLLPEGVMTHLGGAGWQGNLVEQAIGTDRETDHFIGFYQWRQALNQDVTLEAIVQRTGERNQAMAGGIARLSDRVVMSLGLASADEGDLGYTLDLDGRFDRWWLLARSLSLPGTLRISRVSPSPVRDVEDHSIELRYRYSPRLELGLLGRKRRDDRLETEFLLPALSWRPVAGLSLRARPDNEGDYRFELYTRIRRAARLTATVHEATVVDFAYRFREGYELSLTAERTPTDIDRYSAIIHRFSSRWNRLSYRGGMFLNDGKEGFLLGGSMQVLPGVLARLDYRSIPFSPFEGLESEPEVSLQVVTDFSLSRGRIRPANPFSQRQTLGAVSGRILVEGPHPAYAFSLGDIKVLIGGRIAAKTDQWGNFYFGDLKRGVYRVTLDTAGLPLELVPDRTSYVVQVAPGAATRVDFTVRAQYGIAGRVVDREGKPLVGLLVRIQDGDGQVLGEALTDRFGLYRLDGLAPGTYQLTLPRQDPLQGETVLPSRQIVISDDFLFGQDLRLLQP